MQEAEEGTWRGVGGVGGETYACSQAPPLQMELRV